MLKAPHSVKSIERKAAEILKELLMRVPSLVTRSIIVEPRDGADSGLDIVARVRTAGQEHVLVCEVKQSGQPRFARDGINQLKAYLSRFKRHAYPIFIAPFLSKATQEFCRAENVGFLDFEGNAFLTFGPVYIELSSGRRPESERREFRSLYKPRSAQVLRILLRDPKRQWKLSELAAESGVSIGHVSNVRNALEDREWIEDGATGFQLTSPDSLLEAWRESYHLDTQEELKLYTTLHGKQWEKSLRDFFTNHPSAQVALASFSAAQWIAPYGRSGTQYFYADQEALTDVIEALGLTSPAMGENVIIWVPNDRGVFTDRFPAAGIIQCTSPLQTYLDLTQAGERGIESAEHLKRARLEWQK